MKKASYIALVAVLAGCAKPPVEKPFDSVAYLADSEASYRRQFETGMFTPRSYPAGLIQIKARYRTSDPNNSAISDLVARRNGTNQEMDFCGHVFRRNSVGYIDNVDTFYGVWPDKDDGDKAGITALGPEADRLCNLRVRNAPPADKAKG